MFTNRTFIRSYGRIIFMVVNWNLLEISDSLFLIGLMTCMILIPILLSIIIIKSLLNLFFKKENKVKWNKPIKYLLIINVISFFFFLLPSHLYTSDMGKKLIIHEENLDKELQELIGSNQNKLILSRPNAKVDFTRLPIKTLPKTLEEYLNFSKEFFYIKDLHDPSRNNYLCFNNDLEPDQLASYLYIDSDENKELHIVKKISGNLVKDEEWVGKGKFLKGPRDYYMTAFGNNGGMRKDAKERIAVVALEDRVLSFKEESYSITTDCWNSFSCPNVTIGKDQNFQQICKEFKSGQEAVNLLQGMK